MGTLFRRNRPNLVRCLWHPHTAELGAMDNLKRPIPTVGGIETTCELASADEADADSELPFLAAACHTAAA